MKVKCPFCSQIANVTAGFAGGELPCAGCGKLFIVPGARHQPVPTSDGRGTPPPSAAESSFFGDGLPSPSTVLTLGIMSFMTNGMICCCLPVAPVLAILAIRKAGQIPLGSRGYGMVVAGRVLSIISLCMLPMYILVGFVWGGLFILPSLPFLFL